MRTPAPLAVHSFEYERPSQPHTGEYSVEHTVGRAVQVPAVSQLSPAQYWSVVQSALLRQVLTRGMQHARQRGS